MKLLESIINDLVNTNTSLNDPLLKTKVLASRIKNAQLLEWVNSELTGYDEEAVLPDYRIEFGVLMGNYLNGSFQVSNAQIPIPNISREFKELYTKIDNRDSVEAVANLVGKKNIAFSVSNDRKAYLENEIRSQGNHRFQILNLHIQMPANFLSNIVSNVRSKLLELMLQLEQEFGLEADILTLASNNNIINNIMNTTIHNSGDGAIINNGDNNKVEANIQINKGNKKALKEKLLSEKVSHIDIEELLELIDNSTPISSENFGLPVNNWVQKMIGKALDGSWQVGIGAAGNILATALQNYYGIN
jgi:hypothetical protein